MNEKNGSPARRHIKRAKMKIGEPKKTLKGWGGGKESKRLSISFLHF